MVITSELLRDLFVHMEWADARVWEVVLKHEAALRDETVKTYLLHTHGVQRAFLDAWTQQPFSFRNSYADVTLEQEYSRVRSFYDPARGFLASLADAELSAPMTVPWTKWVEQQLGRTPGPTTLGETALQVVMHTTHHRAQVNARLRALGVDPPLLDYIAWLWLERPRPAWAAIVTLDVANG